MSRVSHFLCINMRFLKYSLRISCGVSHVWPPYWKFIVSYKWRSQCFVWHFNLFINRLNKRHLFWLFGNDKRVKQRLVRNLKYFLVVKEFKFVRLTLRRKNKSIIFNGVHSILPRHWLALIGIGNRHILYILWDKQYMLRRK